MVTEDRIRGVAPHMPDDKVTSIIDANDMNWETYKGFEEVDIFNERWNSMVSRVFPAMGAKAEKYLNDQKDIIENIALYFKYDVLETGNLGGTIAKGDSTFTIRLADTTSVLSGNIAANRRVSATAGTAFNLLPNHSDNTKYDMGNGTEEKQEFVLFGFFDPIANGDPTVESIQVDIDDSSISRNPDGIYEQQVTDYPFVKTPLMWTTHSSGIDIDADPVASKDTKFFPVAVELITEDQISDLI